MVQAHVESMNGSWHRHTYKAWIWAWNWQVHKAWIWAWNWPLPGRQMAPPIDKRSEQHHVCSNSLLELHSLKSLFRCLCSSIKSFVLNFLQPENRKRLQHPPAFITTNTEHEMWTFQAADFISSASKPRTYNGTSKTRPGVPLWEYIVCHTHASGQMMTTYSVHMKIGQWAMNSINALSKSNYMRG